MLTKLTLGEKFKDLRLAKGYKSTEHLANVVNIPKTILNGYENDQKPRCWLCQFNYPCKVL